MIARNYKKVICSCVPNFFILLCHQGPEVKVLKTMKNGPLGSDSSRFWADSTVDDAIFDRNGYKNSYICVSFYCFCLSVGFVMATISAKT